MQLSQAISHVALKTADGFTGLIHMLPGIALRLGPL